MPRQRVVLDTNAIVSHLLLPDSIPALAVGRIVTEDQLLVSESTLGELADVLSRPKFDPYVSIAERQQFLRLLGGIAEIVPIVHVVRACRDPRDDKFLELAVNGSAERVVTGEADLLELDPFRGIPIITPGAYLRR